MKIAIMQPYILPYIGYFQLINAVDKFVIYDNIEFTKKGWINRNRILRNNKDEYFTLPLKKDSDFLNINQRTLSGIFINEKNKIIRKLQDSYKKAPQFDTTFPVLQKIFNYDNENLFEFIYNSIIVICTYLEIESKIIISSTLQIDHNLKAQNKIIAICKTLSAQQYINPIGGIDLYSKKAFSTYHIELSFIKSKYIQYNQFNNEFIPWLSLIDVMMFNSKEQIKEYLTSFYTLI